MSDVIKIYESAPGGKGSFQALLKRMSQVEQNADDMSTTFKKIIPDIKAAFRYEFSEANPSGWKALSKKYRQWKIDNGYPATIGIKTGALKRALVEEPMIKIDKRSLIYGVNDSMTNEDGENVGDYAKEFNRQRKIMPYVKKFIRGIVKSAVAAAIKRGFTNG
jgi:hypothetical protein